MSKMPINPKKVLIIIFVYFSAVDEITTGSNFFNHLKPMYWQTDDCEKYNDACNRVVYVTALKKYFWISSVFQWLVVFNKDVI